jgi:SAM-dependent methyltransferase
VPSDVAGCRWCGSQEAEPAIPGREPADFQVRRCCRCGLAYTVPVLGPGEIGAYYQETYYGDTNKRFNPLLEALVGRFRRGRAQTLTSFVPPGKVLDIGCGRGLTLNALRQLGWKTRGCELSETSSRHAREVLGLDVACAGFRPELYADGEFDAVILWHVYEHLYDPQAVLQSCRRILRPGGVLALAVPNSDSFQAKLTKYGWFHLDLPRHYSHFSAPWLRQKFLECGFRPVDEFHGSLEQNPYGWIQSLLNACGFRFNLLYDILRRKSARTTKEPWREVPVQSLFNVLGMIALLPIALAMLIPERLCRRGATVEFYVIREPGALELPSREAASKTVPAMEPA